MLIELRQDGGELELASGEVGEPESAGEVIESEPVAPITKADRSTVDSGRNERIGTRCGLGQFHRRIRRDAPLMIDSRFPGDSLRI